jgi:hypothetical protein
LFRRGERTRHNNGFCCTGKAHFLTLTQFASRLNGCLRGRSRGLPELRSQRAKMGES